MHLTSFPPSRPRASQGLTPYERERAEKIARNAAQMKALGLPALGGIVGAAPSSAGGFTPVRRKNPIATPEPAAPFRIILRERPAKPVNYNVDAFDSEDEEEARERKRARRAETARAGGKPRKRPAAATDDDDCSDYEVESGDEDDDDALGSASDSETNDDDEVDPDPPSAEFLLYGGSLAKKYEVPEHRARANRTAAMYTNGTNWLEESKLNFRACRDRAKARRLAEEEAAREKQEKKLQRRKEKDEGAGAMVVVPGDAPETDDVDVNGKKIFRVGFHTWQGAEGKRRGGGEKRGDDVRQVRDQQVGRVVEQQRPRSKPRREDVQIMLQQSSGACPPVRSSRSPTTMSYRVSLPCAGWRRLRLPRVRLPRRLEVVQRQGPPGLSGRPAGGEGGQNLPKVQ